MIFTKFETKVDKKKFIANSEFIFLNEIYLRNL